MLYKKNIYRERSSGFTLIELLVVIAIIGILAAMIIVNVNSAREKARIASCKTTLRSVAGAMAVCNETGSGININKPEGALNIPANGAGGNLICKTGSADVYPDLPQGCAYNNVLKGSVGGDSADVTLEATYTGGGSTTPLEYYEIKTTGMSATATPPGVLFNNVSFLDPQIEYVDECALQTDPCEDNPDYWNDHFINYGLNGGPFDVRQQINLDVPEGTKIKFWDSAQQKNSECVQSREDVWDCSFPNPGRLGWFHYQIYAENSIGVVVGPSWSWQVSN